MGSKLTKRCCSREEDDGFNGPIHSQTRPIPFQHIHHQLQFVFIDEDLVVDSEESQSVQYQKLCGIEKYLRQRRKDILQEKQKHPESLSTSFQALLDQTISHMLEEESSAEGEYALLRNPTENHFVIPEDERLPLRPKSSAEHNRVPERVSKKKKLPNVGKGEVQIVDRPSSGQSGASSAKHGSSFHSIYHSLSEGEESMGGEPSCCPTLCHAGGISYTSPRAKGALKERRTSSGTPKTLPLSPQIDSNTKSSGECAVLSLSSSCNSENEKVSVIDNINQYNIVESVCHVPATTAVAANCVEESKSESVSSTSPVNCVKELNRKGSGLKQALDEYVLSHGSFNVQVSRGLSHSRTHRKNLSDLDMDTYVSLCQDPYQACSASDQVGILMEGTEEEKDASSILVESH